MKCWEFVKYHGKWWYIENFLIEFGLNGLEDIENSVEICIKGDNIDKMTFPDAQKLLLELMRMVE